MSDLPKVTLFEAADALGMAPLEVLAWCTLGGLDCAQGLLDPGYIEVLRVTGHAATEHEGGSFAADDGEQVVLDSVSSDLPADPHERRLWMLRRVAGKLQRSGKWWPASMDVRGAARGAPDLGLARNAVDALEHAGMARTSSKGGMHRVGLVGERRAELARLIDHGEVTDATLTDWIA